MNTADMRLAAARYDIDTIAIDYCLSKRELRRLLKTGELLDMPQ